MTDLLVQGAGRHSVYVQRYAGYLANLFDPYTDQLIRELKVLISDMPETTQNMRRINKLISDYRKSQLLIYGEYNDEVLLAELSDFAIEESEFAANAIANVVQTPDFETVIPNPQQVTSAVSYSLMVFEVGDQVFNLEDYIRNVEATQARKVGDIIRTGYITGQTSQQIVSSIAGRNGYLKNQNTKLIKTMVRTATNHVSNEARAQTYKANNDIVIGYEIVATLDSRTSNICKGLDGKIVKNNESPKPMPPFHPNCRTATAPVLDERYRLDDKTATRASKGIEGGQQVSADSTYYSWLKNQGMQGKKGRAFVEDVLGKERAALFLDGGLSVERFKRLTLDEQFQPIPLDELRKKRSLQLAFDNIS